MTDSKILISAYHGEKTRTVPFWMMRQAGRYLPEYRELRQKAGGFWEMVYNPDFASEVTVQPIRRFGMDGAIIFSDILVVADILGRRANFVRGEGPKLNPIRSKEEIPPYLPNQAEEISAKIQQTIRQTRQKLDDEGFQDRAVLGFAGGPWTVACYMVEGGSSKEFQTPRLWGYQDPKGFSKLIDAITDATIDYLGKQIEAGVDAIQIFESWAGILSEDQFLRWVVAPTRKICQAIRSAHPDIPIIGFPRGAGPLYSVYARDTGISVIATDHQLPTSWIKNTLQPLMPVQGNLDPMSLKAGGDHLALNLEKILSDLSSGPFVFNLGHGIDKDTPIAHVERLVEIIREFRG